MKDFLKYALYFKHKPQQDELMITVGNDFFKVLCIYSILYVCIYTYANKIVLILQQSIHSS